MWPASPKWAFVTNSEIIRDCGEASMYDQFYGLTGRPFQLTPDPHFYFESVTHRKAMSYLGYGLAQGEGFIVITAISARARLRWSAI